VADANVSLPTASVKAHDVHQFAQGPLTDQPAYVPVSDDEDDMHEQDEHDACPPPIMRRRQPLETIPDKATASQIPTENRWAQIRRAAAERAAAQRILEDRNGSASRPTDNNDTVGEESESETAIETER